MMMIIGINFHALLLMKICTVSVSRNSLSATCLLYINTLLMTVSGQLNYQTFLKWTVPTNELAYLSCVFSKVLYYVCNYVHID
jgi:hypothetical protein